MQSVFCDNKNKLESNKMKKFGKVKNMRNLENVFPYY